MKVIIVSHKDLESERVELMKEAQRWLIKICKLNTRYNQKLNAIKNKIAAIDKQLGDV